MPKLTAINETLSAVGPDLIHIVRVADTSQSPEGSSYRITRDNFLSGYSAVGHTHAAADTISGTFNIARIPTGTTGSTVALGNHTHTFSSLTSKPTTVVGYGITDYNALGDARWLGISATAVNSTLFGGLGIGSFLRSDVEDTKTGGSLIFSDSVALAFGNTSDVEHKYINDVRYQTDLKNTDWQILDNGTTRFTFGRTTGKLTATGGGEFTGDLIVNNNAAAARLILNGDTANTDDDGREDAQIDFMSDAGIYGTRLGMQNGAGATNHLVYSYTGNSGATWDEKFRFSPDGTFTTVKMVASASSDAIDVTCTGTASAIYAKNTATGRVMVLDQQGSNGEIAQFRNGGVAKQIFYGSGGFAATGDISCGNNFIIGGTSFNQTAGGQLDINPNALVRLGRTTNNASFALIVHRGDNSSTANHSFKGIGDSYLAAQNGNVGIGTYSASYKLDVSGTGRFTGNLTANGFYESSDRTLKTNFKKISPSFTSFEFKEDLGRTRYGVIAQEIEATNPELVQTNDEGIKSVNYTDLLVIKVAEQENKLQEQGEEIQKLKTLVEQLLKG